jgi:transposase
MKRQRRCFSTEYKHEAACLVLDPGYSSPEAGRSFDIGEAALRRWVQQLKLERGGGTPMSKALTGEQKRIQELEARVNNLGGQCRLMVSVQSTLTPSIRQTKISRLLRRFQSERSYHCFL